jgi:hypothetical protein
MQKNIQVVEKKFGPATIITARIPRHIDLEGALKCLMT